jgi:tetrahydromethanopterin S-methyltransferase subunit F
MRLVVQLLSVLAIAIGVGLLVAGGEISPGISLDTGTQITYRPDLSARDIEFYGGLAAALKGFGAGFLTLGVAGLVVPWVNFLLYGRPGSAVSPPLPTDSPSASPNPTGNTPAN